MPARFPFHFTFALAVTVFAAACTTEVQEPLGESKSAPPLEEEIVRPTRAPMDQPSVGRSAENRAMADTLVKKQVLTYKTMGSVASPWLSSRVQSPLQERDHYAHFDDNPLKRVTEEPVSTFSVDVDTGAYANMRRWLNEGRLPPENAVRVEELINYFTYEYTPPRTQEHPFAAHIEVAPSPWNAATHLLRIGLKGYEVEPSSRPPANLVFLIDVSGSMRAQNKLELLKPALKLLASRLTTRDRISIAVYAGASGVVLEPAAGDRTAEIHTALDGLAAGGSTNGGAGIRLAYSLARQSFIPGGINRLILATDGDFNVGTVNFQALKDLVVRQRETGVALTSLGFGGGNYNDHLMEQLADAGNGNHAYIDTLNEARKVLVQQMSGTLQTIAKDVKIQIEFNPAVVAEYRLIGYENRSLKREDFSNDRVDAGDIGAGHTVTALYEVALVGSGGERVEALRYHEPVPAEGNTTELAFLHMRFKHPDSDTSELIEWPLELSRIREDLPTASEDFRFAAAVAAFGQILRGGRYTNDFGYRDIEALARSARGTDHYGYRGEFLGLVSLAEALDLSRNDIAGG